MNRISFQTIWLCFNAINANPFILQYFIMQIKPLLCLFMILYLFFSYKYYYVRYCAYVRTLWVWKLLLQVEYCKMCKIMSSCLTSHFIVLSKSMYHILSASYFSHAWNVHQLILVTFSFECFMFHLGLITALIVWSVINQSIPSNLLWSSS